MFNGRQATLILFSGAALMLTTGGFSKETSATAKSRSDAFFGVHFDLHPSATDTILGRDATAENISDFLERVKPDFVQYDCKGHSGYSGYPTRVGHPSPGIVKDALRLWRTETKQRDIGLYVHYSGVWDAVAIEHHPEWARIDESGKPDPNITSTFGDYVTQLMIPQLKEVASEYDLDGLWVDGECWAAKLDYGTTAVSQWIAETGHENVPKNTNDPHWQEWKDFHRNNFEEYLINWVDALHASNPELQICSNWAYTPHMPLPIKAKVDFLSGDFSPKDSVDRARFEARYLDSTGMPWDLMAWGFNGHGAHPGKHPQIKMPQQLMQEASVVMGLGGGMQVYFQPTRGGYIKPVVKETVGAVADFCRERQDISHKSKAIPQVALLLSSKSYLHRSDNVFSPHGQYNALEGALHALLGNGYSVDLLAENQLEPRLNEYSVVVIAQAPVLEDGFRDELMAYVHRGGKIVLLDQDSTKPFKSYIGLSETEARDGGDLVYVGDIRGNAPAPGNWEKVEASEDTKIMEYRTDRYGIVGQDDDNETTALTPWTEAAPAVSVTDILGGQIFAVHGPVSLAYFNAHHPVMRVFIGRIMERAFPEPVARILDAPHMDMSLRSSADGIPTVHLVNLTNAQRADDFAAIDTIPGSGPLELEWVLDKEPSGFKQLPEEEELEFRITGTEDEGYAVRIEVENVPLHAVIVPEFESE